MNHIQIPKIYILPAGKIHASHEVHTMGLTQGIKYVFEYGLWENKTSVPKYMYPNEIPNITCLFMSAIKSASLIPIAKLAVA